MKTPPLKFPSLGPERDALLASGNWIDDCWLLQPEALKNLSHRLSSDAVRRSIEQLALLFPPEVCAGWENLMRRPAGVFEFFIKGIYHHLWPLLFLGTDLATIGSWQKDHGFVAGLRDGGTFYDRRYEAGVWAGLLRTGFETERPLDGGSDKSPDFFVRVDGERIAIELKTLSSGDWNRVVSQLQWAFSQGAFSGNGGIPHDALFGKRLILHCDDYVYEDLRAADTRNATVAFLKDRFPGVAQFVLDAVNGAATYPLLVPIEAVGRIVVSETGDSKSAEADIAGLTDAPLDAQVSRALRSLRTASGQVPRQGSSVVVLHAHRETLPAEDGISEIARVVAADEDRFGHVGAVVLSNQYRDWEAHGTQHVIGHFRPKWSRLDIAACGLVRALGAWRYWS